MQNYIDFSTINWRNDYSSYLDYIKSFATKKLSNFNAKLTPTKYEILGIPVPAMRNIAKQIVLGDIGEYLAILRQDASFEEVMLYGMVIALAKLDVDTKIKYLTKWSGIIDNWAHTDCVGAMLKSVKIEQNKYKNFISELLVSGQEFKIRFAIVLLMDYFLEKDYVDYAVKNISNIDDSKYYISMAIAWFISVLFVKYKDRAIQLLKSNCFSINTINRAVQKIRDSLRVSQKDKEYVLQFKK